MALTALIVREFQGMGKCPLPLCGGVYACETSYLSFIERIQSQILPRLTSYALKCKAA